MCVCVSVCVCVCIIYIYIHMYVCIYIHTYIYIYPPVTRACAHTIEFRTNRAKLDNDTAWVQRCVYACVSVSVFVCVSLLCTCGLALRATWNGQ